MRRVVVVGGSLAGVHAAEALREQGFDGEVTIVSAEAELPYDRPPLSKEVLLGGEVGDRIRLRPDGWYADNGIVLRWGTAARGLDAGSKTLALSDGSTLSYDGLVVATGSAARRMPVTDRQPVIHVIRDLDDALTLRESLRPGLRVLVVGGGFIGSEVASVAARIGAEVTMIEPSSAPLHRVLGREVSQWYRALHERHGVQVLCGCGVETVESAGEGATVALTDGRRIDVDLVVAGIGATPAVGWLEGSGVEVDAVGGVLCAPDLSTAAPGVVAAGDVARWRNPVFDEVMRVEHWTNAVEQGRHAAATLLGQAQPFASVPYFWSDQHGTKMRFVGRATGATDVRVDLATDDALVVAYGRAGVVTGAVCIGAPRQLASYRAAIQQRTPWEDVAPAPLARSA